MLFLSFLDSLLYTLYQKVIIILRYTEQNMLTLLGCSTPLMVALLILFLFIWRFI